MSCVIAVKHTYHIYTIVITKSQLQHVYTELMGAMRVESLPLHTYETKNLTYSRRESIIYVALVHTVYPNAL